MASTPPDIGYLDRGTDRNYILPLQYVFGVDYPVHPLTSLARHMLPRHLRQRGYCSFLGPDSNRLIRAHERLRATSRAGATRRESLFHASA